MLEGWRGEGLALFLARAQRVIPGKEDEGRAPASRPAAPGLARTSDHARCRGQEQREMLLDCEGLFEVAH